MTAFPTGAPTNARTPSETTPSLSVVSDLSVEPDVSVEVAPAPATHDYGQHEVRVEDQGSFTVARCTCGWRSYARRSRDLARREGQDHALLYSPEA